jgi:hypothetical protein
MKMQLHCRECMMRGPLDTTFMAVLPNDNLIQEVECPNHHLAKVIVTRPKFQVLYEVGVNAIVDGYHREAVLSFAASLERSYEYMIRIILTQSSCSSDAVDRFWKPLAKSSERQLGAFLAVWTTRFGASAAWLQDHHVKLRNDVAHNGKIPSNAEAVAFGNEAFKVMFHNMQTLSLDHGIDEFLWHMDTERVSKALQSDSSLQPQDLTTYLVHQDKSAKEPSMKLEAYLETVRSLRIVMEALPRQLEGLAGTVKW